MTIHYLLDVSWLLYRGYYSLSHVYEEYPEIHFLCKKIESLLSRKDAIVHLALDGDTTKGRRLLGESYKGNRCRGGERSVYEALPSFISMIHNDRIKLYYNKNYESDEILFTLSRVLDGRKRIISGDKDIFQALKQDTVIDNGSDRIVTEESYKFEYADKFFEIDPIRLPIYRAIVGDASDTLKPPVSRFPHKLAAVIAKTTDYSGSCPTVEQLVELSREFSDSEKRWVEKLISVYDQFSINFDIMKLNVITDDITNNIDDVYFAKYLLIKVSDFLKSKIERLNTL